MSTSKSAIEARRRYAGPAVLADGFRPFFLGAGVWAAAVMVLWLAQLHALIALPTAFGPAAWHGHEMLFGYVAAVVGGFLLTAIPNWTGRLPVRGRPLAGLFGLWLLGRCAVGLSAWIGTTTAAALDLAFLLALCAVTWREILSGANWRNLPIATIAILVLLGNALAHGEFLGIAVPDGLGLRLGVGAVVCLVALVGGRVVPSFTRNWLAKRAAGRLPRPFGRIDKFALLTTVLASLSWALAPEAMATGVLALLAAVANMLRLAGWCGLRTGSEPLVWSLHLGFAWLVPGFALLGFAALPSGVPATAAVHALTAGAMGTMTLAIMTRATLGHTGQTLHAGSGTTVVYCLITVAALARVLAALIPAGYPVLISLSGFAWIAAFALFAGLYGPSMIGPRQA